MKCIISSTYDDRYLYFLPITVFCWNKLNVDVVCFLPTPKVPNMEKLLLISNTMGNNDMKFEGHYFDAPEHKEATYAQCSRLYGACLDLPENEILITGDIDMAMFKVPEYTSGAFNIFGSDLTPPKQFPICYLMATVKEWRDAFDLNGKSYQECLDGLLGSIEAESFRGNYWCKDQEEAYNKISKVSRIEKVRAKEGTQFSTKRYDRDDAYILDRLSLDTIDFHLLRPGFEESNFNIIMRILEFHYPNDNLQWIINYRNEYLKIL